MGQNHFAGKHAAQQVQFTDAQTDFIIGGGDSFGTLFKTTNGGQSWSRMNVNTTETPYGFFLNKCTSFITGKVCLPKQPTVATRGRA
jgi:photosystem II stability/assembly factor-like uncharacterized protein